MKKVVVVGSGGHAKVVIDILQEMQNVEIVGVTSNTLEAGSLFFDYKVLGDDSVLSRYDKEDCLVAMGLGGYRDNHLREKVYSNLKEKGLRFINVIHPNSIISKSAKLGDSVVIFPGVVINTDVCIGDNTIIATSSSIDHETIIGNNVLVSAGVTIGAYSIIQDGSLIALGSKVISGLKIGKNSVIAAGAVVVSNILDNEIVFGIPAKKR